MLTPFGARVLAITRSGTPIPGAAQTFTPDRLDDVLIESDVVVIGAPATADTRHLIGARELGLMRSHAWLINIARGSLIDSDALVEALRSGSIGGAGLDVTDPEPLPDGHPLWDAPNALITPHSANPSQLLIPGLAARVRRTSHATPPARSWSVSWTSHAATDPPTPRTDHALPQPEPTTL